MDSLDYTIILCNPNFNILFFRLRFSRYLPALSVDAALIVSVFPFVVVAIIESLVVALSVDAAITDSVRLFKVVANMGSLVVLAVSDDTAFTVSVCLLLEVVAAILVVCGVVVLVVLTEIY